MLIFAGQERILSSHVVVVGMGGLGCAVAPYLAGSGVGRLTLIDDDVIDRSNLQRQVLYRESDIGARESNDCCGKTCAN